MASGAPVPVPVDNPGQKILCIADLEEAASKKMEKGPRGEFFWDEHLLTVKGVYHLSRASIRFLFATVLRFLVN
jgi:hypothetical protein